MRIPGECLGFFFRSAYAAVYFPEFTAALYDLASFI